MRVSPRQLNGGELDHELVWLSVSLSSLAMAALWFALHLPWPHCVFHDLTGLPCMTCGGTRAGIEFFHGHFIAAWNWNPLIFSALCGLSLFNVYAAIVLATRAPRLRISRVTTFEKNFVRIVVVALFALNWIYLLSHSRNYA